VFSFTEARHLQVGSSVLPYTRNTPYRSATGTSDETFQSKAHHNVKLLFPEKCPFRHITNIFTGDHCQAKQTSNSSAHIQQTSTRHNSALQEAKEHARNGCAHHLMMVDRFKYLFICVVI
jgi:hypothetical protein